MGELGMLASTAGINTGINAGGNLLGAALNNYFWNQQAKKSYELNEKAANNAQQRTIDLYNLLQSPSAMVQQLKDAGLSPSLMYNKGGMGGSVQAGAQGGGPSGMNGAQVLGMGKVLDPLTIAQIKNINADTAKKKEETTKTKFDTMLSHSMTELNKSQTKLNELDWEFSDKSFYYRLNNLYMNMTKLQGEAMSAIANGTLDQESYEERLARYAIDNIKAGIEIELLKSKTKLTNAEKEKALTEVRQIAEEILLIQAKTSFYNERTTYTSAQTNLAEHEAEAIYRKYSWNYFTKEDLFKAWDCANNTAGVVADFIPTARLGKMVNETVTYDSSGKVTRSFSRQRPAVNTQQ